MPTKSNNIGGRGGKRSGAGRKKKHCEEMTNKLGFLSKHPTTGKPIPSPFINIGINYMNQSMKLWNEIFQIVRENCTTEFIGNLEENDLMEQLLRSKEKKNV